jgi:hypothetical protein
VNELEYVSLDTPKLREKRERERGGGGRRRERERGHELTDKLLCT